MAVWKYYAVHFEIRKNFLIIVHFPEENKGEKNKKAMRRYYKKIYLHSLFVDSIKC